MRTLAFLTLVLLLAACHPIAGHEQPSPHPEFNLPPEIRACATPRRVVAAIDVTGSYESAELGRDRIADVIEREACPGDTFFIRKITEDSFPPAAHILTAEFASLPTSPEPPTNGNPIFFRKWEKAMNQWRGLFDQHRQQAATLAVALRQEDLDAAPATDIYGAILKAEDLLAHRPDSTVPVLLIASDMLDTQGFEGPANLAGVHTVVLAFEAENALATRQLRKQWSYWFQVAHVESVTFFDVAEPAPRVLPVSSLGQRSIEQQAQGGSIP